MKLETIKNAVAHLPHVKTVWVEDSNIFIHEKKGAEKIDLDALPMVAPSEPAAPIKPVEPISQPSEPAEKEEAKSTNKKNK